MCFILYSSVWRGHTLVRAIWSLSTLVAIRSCCSHELVTSHILEVCLLLKTMRSHWLQRLLFLSLPLYCLFLIICSLVLWSSQLKWETLIVLKSLLMPLSYLDWEKFETLSCLNDVFFFSLITLGPWVCWASVLPLIWLSSPHVFWLVSSLIPKSKS